MKRIIDLRSDTVTKPTEEMREAAKLAIVGDDVFDDDPTVHELEAYAADLVGKEAALFVSSGTQGNLVSVLSQTNPGDAVLLEQESHIYNYEVGSISAVGGVIPILYNSNRGYATRTQLMTKIRPENIHYPNLTLLCIENTHNRHGGAALAPEQVGEMASFAREHDLNVHLDGARIFNACVAHSVDVKRYAKFADTIQFCLSKGLSAPIGSIVAGDEDLIKIARKKRKMLGGGMRQVGIIAAPGLIALRDMRDRLVIDHINARSLAEGIRELGLPVSPTDTNIVICDVSSIFNHASEAIKKLEDHGILTVPFGTDFVRLTTNRHITEEDVEFTLNTIEKYWIKEQKVH